MAKGLTTSQIERQNVLNNTVALPRIQEELNVKALEFEGRYVLTKQMVADYYGVDIRTKTTFLGLFDFRSFLNIGICEVKKENNNDNETNFSANSFCHAHIADEPGTRNGVGVQILQ